MKRTLVSSCFVLAMLAGVVVAPAVAQNTGRLKVDADPTRAGLFLDGEYIGPARNHGTVRRYTLPAGTYELTLRDSGHQDLTQTITITAGETTELDLELEPRETITPPWGTLRTRNSDGLAAVFVNDQFMGHADEFNNVTQGLYLKPGEYEIRIEPREGAATTETVTITADQTTIIGTN
jgi:hypothetical protein